MKDEKWIDNTKFGFKPMVSTYYPSFDELSASIGANSSVPADESKNKK